jgi:acyl-CoA reductase-like NAD-dependent aldehyde dehydrogenase
MNDLVTPEFGFVRARSAKAAVSWSATPLARRLAIVRRARRLMATGAAALAASVTRRPVADTLVAEVLPLLEAARFLERRAPALLAPQRPPGVPPVWLFGVSTTLLREPLGTVLLLGPGNYPLFLVGVQALQAIVAGNAVCLKPAPEGAAAAAAFAAILARAGLPDGVLCVLDPAAGPAAVAAGFDRIVLTGSAETGASVLAAAAASLTPATMELSGSDAVFVLPGADLGLVARCLAYGLRLNGGATCIAPRRVFVTSDRAEALEQALLRLLPAIPDADVPPLVAGRLQALLNQAASMGGRVHRAGPGRPAVLADARADLPLLQQDVFAPWLALLPVADMEQALADDAACPFALGASVFGPLGPAQALAARVRAGSVCVNDLIVPTADPRLPFGGGRRSGFGRTRGAEGLLEFTAVKTISVRRGGLRPYLAAPRAGDAGRFAAMCATLHGGWQGVLAARGLVREGQAGQATKDH